MEYKEIINTNREYGSRKTKEYIFFCLKHYKFKMNIGGTIAFMKDLIDFVTGIKDYIPNLYSLGFFEWLKERENDN